MAAAAATALNRTLLAARAAWDTNPGPKPLTIPKPKSNTKLRRLILSSPSPSPASARPPSPSLLGRDGAPDAGKTEQEVTYLGFERWWLPPAPSVKKPRSIYNAATLAYVGDCIYELYARRHFLFPPLSISQYNERVMKVVRCEAQDILLKKLLDEDYLTEDERDILRWGKNITTSNKRSRKRAGVAVYNRASSLETLIGYLYLTDVARLEELMFQLGFSIGASSWHIAEELRLNLRRKGSESAKADYSDNQPGNVPRDEMEGHI